MEAPRGGGDQDLLHILLLLHHIRLGSLPLQLALHILDTNLSRLRWQAVISLLFLFSHCPPASAAWTSPTSELGSLALIRQETAAVTVGINSLAGIAFTGTTPTPTHFNLQNLELF